MTPAQHYEAAEELLAEAELQHGNIDRALDLGGMTDKQLHASLALVGMSVRRALVHATLATVTE
jgi:hypothetical protein